MQMESFEEMDVDNNNVKGRRSYSAHCDSSATNISKRPSVGMNVSRNEANEKPCICNRPMAHVLCRKCGTEFDGRVFMQCQAHPNKIPLMDHQECVNRRCRSHMLYEMSALRK